MFSSTRTQKKRSRPSDFSTKPKQDEFISISGDTQAPIPLLTTLEVAYCIFCKKNSPPLIKLPSGIFINLTGNVHEICLKHKGCCECGVLGLCYRCTVKDCQRLIHSWCAQSLHGNSNFCDSHSSTHKKKDTSRMPFIKSISRKIISSSFWERDYKDKDSPALLCNGHVFWNLLNLEYFPPGYDLNCFPTFPLCSQFDLEYESNSSENYVNKMMERVVGDLEKLQASNSALISQIMIKVQGPQFKREGVLPSTLKANGESLRLKSEMQGVSEIVPGLLNRCEIVGNGEDNKNFCVVCDDFNLEDIALCIKCSLPVHNKCYKISGIEEFVCDPCKYYGVPTTVNCVLCPKKDGIFKMTLHFTKDILFPNYIPVQNPKPEVKQPIWVHSFCALHTSGVVFRDKGVDLSCIDTTRLHIYCEICKSRQGLCLQCNFPTCFSNFHANCARDLLTPSKSSEKKLYCPLHKPTKLRKILETRQKQLSEDLYKFCKGMEKYLNQVRNPSKQIKKRKRIKSKNSSFRIFSADEDLLLDYKIQQYLYKLNISQKKPFILNINLTASTRCSRVNISRPQYYTIISPYVIIEDGICIDGRTPEECFKRYQDTLFNKLKNEMLLLGTQICVYQGKDIQPSRNYTKLRKRPQDNKFKISADTYCICKQPYYYEIPWEPEWSQEEWEQKIRDNEMIECTKCEKWFHLKCVGYEGSLEKAQMDENWKCGICDEKLIDKSSKCEVVQGVTTRRGAKTL